ncbi:MAG: two-component regulator propeller domain-containing protein [Syntrophomonadaceae bacterium]
MKPRRYLLLIFTVFTAYFNAFSQQPAWKVFNTSNSGLPTNNINCVAIDKDGIKWIGTDFGLVRYDDYSWQVFDDSNSPLIRNGRIIISSISIDSLNNKWICTTQGLYCFDGANWKSFNTQNSRIPSDNVNYVLIGKLNKKLICTSSGKGPGGFAIFNDTSWTVFNTSNKKIPSDVVNSAAIDKNGNIWIAMEYLHVEFDSLIRGGIGKYDGNNWTFYNSGNSGLISLSPKTITFDGANQLWTAENNLEIYDGKNWRSYTPNKKSLPYQDVNSINFDYSGTMWISMGSPFYDIKGGSMVKYDGINFTVYDTANSPLPLGYVNSIFTDPNNNKWISVKGYVDRTNWKEIGGGLAVFNENGVVNVNSATSLESGSFILNQNYPNPFNPSTRITYSLPEAQNVNLTVYDMLGKEVSTLVSEYKPAGQHSVQFNAGSLPSGIYVYIIQAGEFRSSRKLLLLK